VEICLHGRHFRDTYVSISSHVIKGSKILFFFCFFFKLTSRESQGYATLGRVFFSDST
jgi:hypothetical protein